MQKFSLGEISRWVVDQDKKKPEPFPGKFPTRVAWTATATPLMKIDDELPPKAVLLAQYFGKPSAFAGERLARIMARRQRFYRLEIKTWEFDRRNLLGRTIWNQPFAGNQMQFNITLWSAYHLFNAQDYVLGWSQTPFLKNIGGFRVYSPRAVLTVAEIRQYREWHLVMLGKQLKSNADRRGEAAERKRVMRVKI